MSPNIEEIIEKTGITPEKIMNWWVNCEIMADIIEEDEGSDWNDIYNDLHDSGWYWDDEIKYKFEEFIEHYLALFPDDIELKNINDKVRDNPDPREYNLN